MNATPTGPEDPRDDDALAAEFVLGLADGDERKALERRLETDAGFAALVSAWQARLSGLDAEFAEMPPPARVKAGIDAALFGGAADDRAPGFWRRLVPLAAFAAGAIATLAVVTVLDLDRPQDGPAALLAAPLTGDGAFAFVAVFDPADDTLRVRQIGGETPSDTALELWVIAGDAPPASLGLVDAVAEAPVVEAGLAQVMTEGVTLAVTLEPPGGSPIPGPTGPVVAAGALTDL